MAFFKFEDRFFYTKKGCLKQPFVNQQKANYLFITYIVTSKPKRISVAAGVVHMIISLKLNDLKNRCCF